MTEEDEANSYRAYLSLGVLSRDFDPADVTRCLGIEPSRSWRRGDLHANGNERRRSHWALASQLPKTASIEQHIRDVLRQMDANSTGFIEVSKELGGCMQAVGYFHTGYPGLYFERDIVEGLARFHLTVDFDFYSLYSHRRNFTEG
jgi:hypothetical protein